MVTRIVAFDVDGVLIDSYSCIPRIYREIGREFFFLDDLYLEYFVDAMIIAEDINDGLKNYPQTKWWPYLLKALQLRYPKNLLSKMLDAYWKKRNEYSRLIDGVSSLLDLLKQKNWICAIVCGNDGIPGLKLKRIQQQKIDRFFTHIFIEREDVASKRSGIRKLLEKYKSQPERVYFIDDKPEPLKSVEDLGINLVQISFDGPLKLGWRSDGPKNVRVLKNLDELKEFLSKIP